METGGEPRYHHRQPAMTATTLTVSDFAAAGQFWTQFRGEEIDHITIIAENGTRYETRGLLHICNRWYINGPVRNSYIISTLCGGPIQATANTKIEFKKPAGARAFRKPAAAHKKIWD
jgi:hypothetical protein